MEEDEKYTKEEILSLLKMEQETKDIIRSIYFYNMEGIGGNNNGR